jgi:hypothetical protein
MRPVTLTTSDASGGAVSSAVCPPDIYLTPFQITLQTIVTGTVNYDVQYTKDDVFSTTFVVASAQWTSVTGMTGATANAEETLISPVTGIRVLQNSGSGSVSLRILQAGAA